MPMYELEKKLDYLEVFRPSVVTIPIERFLW